MKASFTALIVASLGFMSVSCGKAEPQAARPEQQTPTPSATPAPATGRAVSAIRACEIVKGDEVVKLASATKLQIPPSELSPGESQGCVYLVLLAAGDSEYFHVSFQNADLTAALLSATSATEKGERVDGPWDEAWFGKYPLGTGMRLLALRRGDYGLEVRTSGNRKEPVIEIAKLAVSRAK